MYYYPKKIEEWKSQANFLSFLNNVWKEDAKQFNNLEISHKELEDIGLNLGKFIKNNLNTLKTGTPNLEAYNEGLKGLYFSLGDDGRSLSIGGSIYYNEIDWAANADFYQQEDAWETLDPLIDTLTEQRLPREIIKYIVLLFLSYILLKTLSEFQPNYLIKNAGVVVGFCNGDELILGHFKDGQFTNKVKFIEDGKYELPSSAPIINIQSEPIGPLWHYIHWNFRDFLKEQNLYLDFIKLGEQGAESLCKAYPKELFVNRCLKCSFIKKTPKASLCLNCGDFSPSLFTHIDL